MTRPIEDPERFVRDNTVLSTPPLVPEICLHLANEVVPLWEATEEDLADKGLPPPYWAFAWAGGQALARYLLDHPETVAGKRVLDFAAGSGVQGIAAALAGASNVVASEIDPFALAALGLNAAANGVKIEVQARDLLDESDAGWQVVLAGDVCYERPMAARVVRWLKEQAGQGAAVYMGDPGRSYMPKTGLIRLAGYSVRTSRDLEDCDVRNTSVWQVTDKVTAGP